MSRTPIAIGVQRPQRDEKSPMRAAFMLSSTVDIVDIMRRVQPWSRSRHPADRNLRLDNYRAGWGILR